LLAIYFSGGYDKPVRILKIIRGVFFGSGIILIGYALLPEEWRFSRALILFGAAWALASLLMTRLMFSLAGIKGMRIDSGNAQRIAIVGSPDECRRVKGLLNQTGANTSFIGFVNVSNDDVNDPAFLGRFGQLHDIVTIYSIDEVIFCAKDLPSHDIIDRMAQLGDSRKVSYKIAPPESLSIIGSNSIDTAGDLYVIDINSVSKPVNRRNKRVIDVSLALALLSLSPILMWAMKKPFGFIGNIFSVLVGMKSWVGYAPANDNNIHLPKIRPGVLNPSDVLPIEQRTAVICGRLNLLYAKDYQVGNDLNVVRNAFRELGK